MTAFARTLTLGTLAIVAACSDDHGARVLAEPGDPFGNHAQGNVNVIGADEAAGSSQPSGGDVGTGDVLVGSPSDGDVTTTEICVSDSLCEEPGIADSGFCEREGGPVDLIYVDGELVETICYPPAEDPERPLEVVSGTMPGDIEVAQNANRTTVVFDPATDGTAIEGDVFVDGNNVAIYGNGPDATILDGEVVIDGNNTRLRGVTITGDLVLRKNRVAIVLCRILGNVRLETMSTNGSVFAENDVFGSFTSTSNGNLIVGNDVMGDFVNEGSGNVCDRNTAFTDLDGDQRVGQDELGASLACD
jgi:hypothetical protein